MKASSNCFKVHPKSQLHFLSIQQLNSRPNPLGDNPFSCVFHGFHVRVELATKVVDDSEKLKQTLCHELCHVAAWVVLAPSRCTLCEYY